MWEKIIFITPSRQQLYKISGTGICRLLLKKLIRVSTFSGSLLQKSELQIRRGKRDNLGIIVPITPVKCILRPFIRGSSDEGLQQPHIFAEK